MAAWNYQDLVAWQKAMELAERVYEVSKKLPVQERYGLTAQVRRSAVSVLSNIAEGQGRYSKADFKRFLSVAHGSLREVETQLILTTRLGFVAQDAIESLLDLGSETGRLVNGLAKSLEG
ncbi:MAG: four helix bundle protein [Myxococcales bacterium]|nr:four helix bundle protein [Myxococcales bacterium]